MPSSSCRGSVFLLMVQVPEFRPSHFSWTWETVVQHDFFSLIVSLFFFLSFFFFLSLSFFFFFFLQSLSLLSRSNHARSLAFLACVCFCKRTDLLNNVTVQADALNNNVRTISDQHTHFHTRVKESVKRQATVWQEQ